MSAHALLPIEINFALQLVQPKTDSCLGAASLTSFGQLLLKFFQLSLIQKGLNGPKL